MKRLLPFLRTVLGLVFLLASFDKLLHPQDFAYIVANYRILPDLLVNPVALFLPWLEFVCGLCLVFNVFSRGATFIITTLMSIFLAALGFNYFRGLDVACGCFTTDPSAQADTVWTLVRDGVIALTSLLVFWLLVLEQRKSR
jgi:uncharacterized membrane protein YphA (DoxX/SURF4 family)